MTTIVQKRIEVIDRIARIEARQAEAAVQTAKAAAVKAMRRAGALQVLLLDAGMPLVRTGGNSLHELREEMYDAMRNANGRAGVHDICAVYESAMMGGEPYAVWN